MLVKLVLVALISALLVLVAVPAHSQFAIFQVASTLNTIQTLKIGAGGQLTHVDVQCDQGFNACNNSGTTTKVVTADTYGAYVWMTNGTCDIGIPAPCWQQLVTHTTLPVGDSQNAFSVCGAGVFCGVVDLRIAPSNTNIAYMFFNGLIYSTSNLRSGANVIWTRTTFAAVSANPNGNTKFQGPFIAIDPHNSSVLLVSTPLGPAYYSTDAGAHFTPVTLGTACTPGTVSGDGAGFAFVFDPSSWTSGNTPGIFLSCYGTGVYHSTTGVSGTFALLSGTGMPTTVNHMAISSAGLLYVADGTNTVKWNGSTWTNIWNGVTFGSAIVAVDPATSGGCAGGVCVVVSGNGGQTGYTVNATAATPTFTSQQAKTRTATDIPWLANTLENFMTGGDMTYDPAQSNTVYFAEGIGVWFFNPQNVSNGTNAYTSQSKGIEQLVANWITSPVGGNPILGAWDRPIWTITNQAVYPSNHGTTYNQGIKHGWSTDWASGGYVFGLATCGGSAADDSAYSATGGGSGAPASWTAFTNLPSTTQCGGSIAALDSTHIAIAQNMLSNANLYITIDRGASAWTIPTCAGVPTTGVTGWGANGGINSNRHILTADKVGGNYYAYNTVGLGVYKITSTGTCTQVKSTVFETAPTDNFAAQLTAAPSPASAGHLFFTAGQQNPDNATQAFWHCTDSGTFTCSSTDSYVNGVTDVFAYGFGKNAPGDPFPAIYVYGRVGGVPGLWRGTSLSTTAVWTPLSPWWIGNWIDAVTTVAGDPNTYGKVNIGFLGSGFKYGQFNFLLKRDLDPAANDNDPMWLEKAA